MAKVAPLDAEKVNIMDYLPKGLKLKNVGYSQNPEYCNMLLRYAYDFIDVDPETNWESIEKAFPIKAIGAAAKKTVKQSFKVACLSLFK
jgi:hypothetical protein